MRRFAQLWQINATREIPAVLEVGRRLADELPDPLPDTVVHGDYRLGNLMVERDRPDASRQCSTGRWARSATRARTSATCSRRTPSRAAAEPARCLAGHRARRLPDEGGARRTLCRAERPGGRAARLVRGARAVEGRGLLRGDLRPLRAGRARRRGRARGRLRARRAADGRDRRAAPRHLGII